MAYNNNGRNNNTRYNPNNNDRDKEPRKDWKRKTAHQPNGLPKNLRVTIPVSCYGITNDGKEYDGTSFIDLMDDLQRNNTFMKISVPIYMKANYTGNPEARWNTVVGYIKSFSDIAEATCVIYTKSIKYYENLEDAIIVPRVVIKEGKCVCIIGLDIMDRKDIKKK